MRRKTDRSPRRPRADQGEAPRSKDALTYARVSSKEQETGGFSIPAQQRLLRDYAAEKGLPIVKEFVDVETAKRAGRTNFQKMITYLKRNHPTCRVILVEKTDRLYRNIKDWVTLDDLDLEIHLVKEGVVLSDDARSTDKFMHGIRVLMAKNYVDNLSEEATKGMREKARQGFWPSRAPLGYLNVVREDGKKVIVPDPERWEIVKRLFDLAAAGGHSLADLARVAKGEGLTSRYGKRPVNKATVHHVLHNRIYTGDFVWREELYSGVHTPMISLEQWETVQDVLGNRYQKQRHKARRDFAFSGLMTCGHCGCALVGELKKERYIYYHCTGHRQRCPEPYVREEVLEDRFGRILDGLALSPDVLGWVTTALQQSHEDERRFHHEAVDRLQAEYTRVQRRLEALYVDKLDGAVDDETYDRLARKWQDGQIEVRRRLAEHEAADRSYMDQGVELLELAANARHLYDQQPPAEKRRLLGFVLSNCSWKDGELTVALRQPFDIIAEMATASARQDAPEEDPGALSSYLVGPAGFEPATTRL